MSDSLHLTILYIPEVPGVFSQGRTKDEAREMALDALSGMLELRAGIPSPSGSR